MLIKKTRINGNIINTAEVLELLNFFRHLFDQQYQSGILSVNVLIGIEKTHFLSRFDLEVNSFKNKREAFTICQLHIGEFNRSTCGPGWKRMGRVKAVLFRTQVGVMQHTFDRIHVLLSGCKQSYQFRLNRSLH